MEKLLRAFLLLVVVCTTIYLKEMYWPLPDFSKQEYERYEEKALSLSKYGVPVPVLVYFKIEEKEDVKVLLKKYKKLKGKPVQFWIKGIEPKLSEKDAIKILKYSKLHES